MLPMAEAMNTTAKRTFDAFGASRLRGEFGRG
jgi:hypothetical protein